jgi:hypothetical protein
MKEHRNLIGLAASVLLAFSPAAWAGPTILFNTGLGAIGTGDAHYTLVDGSGALPLIQALAGGAGQLIGAPGPWVANPGNGSKWISPWITGTSTDPWVNDTANYTYIFQTIAQNSGTISGNWSSDNGAQIWLNGVATGQISPGYSSLSTFNLTLHAGDIVDFYVLNGPLGPGQNNPAGLLVDVTSMSFSTSFPDGGATVMLLGAALSAMGLFRKKLIA